MVIEDGLAQLGVERMLLAIHDASFPADPDEDVGRGSPATRAAERLFAYARSLGFTGFQLGPQGQTSRDNWSPYDGTIFARHLGTIALGSFAPGGPYAGLVGDATLASAVDVPHDGPAHHAAAWDATRAVVAEAHATLARDPDRHHELAARLAAFRSANAWLAPIALHSALRAERGTSFRQWSEAKLWIGDDEPDHRPRTLADRATHQLRTRLCAEHAPAIDRYALGQLLAHEEHARVRERAARYRLALYGDLQVGYSDGDAWIHAGVFLHDYAMGAPPSRTNPEGQPWSYPVLDPAQYHGRVRELVLARIDKAFAEYDSIRIDHPHGLVCPWVYRTDVDHDDPTRAVREGARLFESPELPDHPALARFAIATPDQIDTSLPRHHDHWVRELSPSQIGRYAVLVDTIVESAVRHGRAPADISCEVLSTMPHPLACVLARHGLGRWRVLQKANLDDATDVYRMETAQPADWVMIGNHDTPSIFGLLASWSPGQRERWARHLAARLALREPARLASPGYFASAMLAELFASRARNVSIFFADLFGFEERYNAPGTYNDVNWTLRLPARFEDLHRARLARGAALDIPLAIELALAAPRDA